MTPKHSSNSVAAKARKRLAEPPPDYFDLTTYDRPDHQLISRNCRTGETHVLTLFISPQRVNQFRVRLDGKPWKERIGKSRLLAGLRKALPTYSRFTD